MNTVSIALSGLHAASRRVEAVASNIANSRTSARREDVEVGQAAAVRKPRDETVYRPLRVDQQALPDGGVQSEFVAVEPSHRLAYRPDDARADGEGYVAMPDVDYGTEFVELSQAENAYKANLKVIETEDEMIGALIDEIH